MIEFFGSSDISKLFAVANRRTFSGEVVPETKSVQCRFLRCQKWDETSLTGRSEPIKSEKAGTIETLPFPISRCPKTSIFASHVIQAQMASPHRMRITEVRRFIGVDKVSASFHLDACLEPWCLELSRGLQFVASRPARLRRLTISTAGRRSRCGSIPPQSAAQETPLATRARRRPAPSPAQCVPPDGCGPRS